MSEPFPRQELQQLFAEADLIGAKYQTPEEIAAFNAELAQATAELREAMAATDKSLDALKD